MKDYKNKENKPFSNPSSKWQWNTATLIALSEMASTFIHRYRSHQ